MADHTSKVISTALSSAAAQQRQLLTSRTFALLALGGLLQTIGEALALGAPGALPAGSALLIFGSVTPGVLLLCFAIRRQAKESASDARQDGEASLFAQSTRFARLARAGLLALLLLGALWTAATGGALLIQHPLDPAIYDSDAAAFIQYQGEDVLHGVNPYTDSAGFWQAIQQFPNAGATPLQRGQFAGLPFSPDDNSITALLRKYAHHPNLAGPEFDPASLHSYPAGAFLLAVPFLWAGFPSTQPLYLLSLLLLLALLVRCTPRGQRWQTLLLCASCSIPIALTLRSSFEVICILCILGAWRSQERHPWLSAGLMGLGCAVKQLAWLFLPFYLIWIASRWGWRRAAVSGALCALVFFAINAPFLLNAPAAWASSMLLPILEPAFPGGIGLITLAQGGWMPLLSSWVYTTLEMLAYLGLLGWYTARQFRAKAGRKYDDQTEASALVLAALPLLLAWRSLISYTMFLPILALAAVLQQAASQQPEPAYQASDQLKPPEASRKSANRKWIKNWQLHLYSRVKHQHIGEILSKQR